MRIGQMAGVLILFLALSGCFSGGKEFLLYSPHSKVENTVYDQGIRNHVSNLSQGPTVEGTDCESAILGLIPLPPSFHIMPDLDKAYADAMEKAGIKYDAMIKVEVTHTQYLVPPPLLRVICWDIKGIAVKNAPYVASDSRRQ
jgi:hypothetical protein